MSKDRKKGCLYGLAIGDALGAAVEFCPPGSFAPVVGYRGFGPHQLKAGQWTDDTSMALALADSIAYGWNTKDQLARYLNWFQSGAYSVNGECFDIGCTTRNALYEFELNEQLISDNSEYGSGNGSIMRLAPIAIKYAGKLGYGDYLQESSRTTHASPQCVSGCLALGIVLEKLLSGKDKETALAFEPQETVLLHPSVKMVAEGSYRNASYGIEGSGWVVKSLEASLWAFYKSDSFEEAVLKAVNLGDDADTTGAVTGQLAGAFWGYSGIPQSLIDGLDRKDMIDKYLDPILEE